MSSARKVGEAGACPGEERGWRIYSAPMKENLLIARSSVCSEDYLSGCSRVGVLLGMRICRRKRCETDAEGKRPNQTRHRAIVSVSPQWKANQRFTVKARGNFKNITS